MIQDIIIELKKRDALVHAINAIIEARYEAAANKRLRRGAVQEEILEILGIQRTNMLCALINNLMKQRGHNTIINRGAQYYSNVTHRPSRKYE